MSNENKTASPREFDEKKVENKWMEICKFEKLSDTGYENTIKELVRWQFDQDAAAFEEQAKRIKELETKNERLKEFEWMYKDLCK